MDEERLSTTVKIENEATKITAIGELRLDRDLLRSARRNTHRGEEIRDANNGDAKWLRI
jgi:hypothetical protein